MLGEVETYTYLIASCVRNNYAKNYQNLLIFIELTIDNIGNVFSGFLFISTHISFDLHSLGSAEAYIEWNEKLNGYLMASCVRNICTKNVFQVTVENVGDTFFRTQCITAYCMTNFMMYRQSRCSLFEMLSSSWLQQNSWQTTYNTVAVIAVFNEAVFNDSVIMYSGYVT